MARQKACAAFDLASGAREIWGTLGKKAQISNAYDPNAGQYEKYPATWGTWEGTCYNHLLT